MWKPPQDDGGSCLTEYIIELRDKDKRTWKQVLKVPANVTTGHIEAPHIKEFHQYEFLVIACNSAGPSEPSEPSTTIEAKTRFLKPQIDRSTLQKKVLRVDQLLRVDADYVGAPEPTIAWSRQSGDVLVDDDHFNLNSGDYHTSLVVKKAQRCDSGVYKIVAKNEVGVDTAEFEIQIVSVPGKPSGQIDVSNVTSHGCHLLWKPPKDDGGNPIQNYTIEKMDMEKGVWLPCGETLGKTPEFDVEGLTEGCTYMFRVRAVNNEGESDPLETDYATLAKNPYDPPGPPEYVKVEDWDRKWVNLSWQKPQDDGGSYVTHYVIEKKEDFSSKWAKVIDTDNNECGAKVSDLIENSQYQFRVKAVNRAGTGPPSVPTDEVICKTRNAPPVIDRSNLDKKQLHIGQQLKLDVRISGEPIPEKIWCFNNAEVKSTAGLSLVHEDYKSKFLITAAKRSNSGTYFIKASNKNGEDQAELDLLVLGPPSIPVGPLSVLDIFADRCKVTWKEPHDDGGSPISHYIVEKLDLNNNIWTACGKSSELQCAIEGLEEHHEYQFRVKAINSEGESEPLEGKDTIKAKNPFKPPGPPGKPVMTDFDWDHFDFKWDEPSYDGGDKISGYIIEKKLSEDDVWMKCAEIKPKKELGTAKGVQLGEVYVFRVRAVNAAGPGMAGPESDNMTTRHKKLKPKINRQTIKELTVPIKVNLLQMSHGLKMAKQFLIVM
jgi:hypothetical protein